VDERAFVPARCRVCETRASRGVVYMRACHSHICVLRSKKATILLVDERHFSHVLQTCTHIATVVISVVCKKMSPLNRLLLIILLWSATSLMYLACAVHACENPGISISCCQNKTTVLLEFSQDRPNKILDRSRRNISRQYKTHVYEHMGLCHYAYRLSYRHV
jgi:hypothetical protein